jgi:hypothetical protein
MKRISTLTLVAVLTLSMMVLMNVGRAQGRTILVFSSDVFHGQSSAYPVVALDNLGLVYKYVYDDGAAFLGNLTSQSWDLVVVDEPGLTVESAYDALNSYVSGGGKLVISTYHMSDTPSSSLWATLGVANPVSFDTPIDVFQLDTSHSIFHRPNTLPNPLTGWTDYWADDGDAVEVIGTGVAIGGNEGGPMLVVGNGGRTIFNGFLWDELTSGSPKPYGVALIENEVSYVLGIAVGGEILSVDVLSIFAPYLLYAAVISATALAIVKRKRLFP